MGKKTALYSSHVALQAKMVDFAGWDLPIHYGSQLQEHQAVREKAGVFDVSHMGIFDVAGQNATAFLRWILANDVAKLVPGKALYSCMLNEQGGVLDDLIVYKIYHDRYRLVVNAATREKDFIWLQQHLSAFQVQLTARDDLAILATQGPQTATKIAALFTQEAPALQALPSFHALTIGHKWVARTGYTGEDGYEWILPHEEAPYFWQQLLDQGFVPCGLGARDTLRLEAGLNLYGSDMDETVTPLESNLAWTVAWLPQERNFMGQQALVCQQQEGVKKKLLGLIVEGPGIPRSRQKVMIEGLGEGEVTSGSFSPTLKIGIALARVPAGHFTQCMLDIRGKKVPARVVSLPFVKHHRS